MEVPDIIGLVEINAYGVYLSCLVGNPAPSIKRLLERITHPKIGDLVLETSTLYAKDRNGYRLGRLLRHETEFRPYGGEEPEGTGYYEECWYIETLAGSEYRWHNANFIVVMDSLRDFR